MSGRLTIALDAMGGDQAPEMVLRGADMARARHPDISFLLFGDEARLKPLLTQMPDLADVSEIRHTTLHITDEEKPSQALRSGRNSSMGLAIQAVREKQAAGVVSAGNTGALMAMSKFILKMLPGIHRPAIASFLPTTRGESVMLDLGANIECDADNLVQFAVMGEVFARTVLGRNEPTVGILNVGSEELKGGDALREASATLRKAKLPIRFHGFIEGTDIGAGTVDVIVTDGFTGNVALKTAEGTARLYSDFLRKAFKSSPLAGLGYLLARSALNRLRDRVDPRRYNGAIFLGLDGIVIKSHGSSDSLGFATAVGLAVDMVKQSFMQDMRREFEVLLSDQSAATQVAAG